MVSLVRIARTALVLAAGLFAQAFAQPCSIAALSTFCIAGTTVHGCVPSISAVGTPSASAASRFQIDRRERRAVSV